MAIQILRFKLKISTIVDICHTHLTSTIQYTYKLNPTVGIIIRFSIIAIKSLITES